MGFYSLCLSQLESYSLVEWSIVICWMFILSTLLGKSGILLSHFVVAVFILLFDFKYVSAHPGEGEMEIAGLGVVGFLFRVVLINMVLLPFSYLFFRLGKKYRFLYLRRWRRAG